MYDTRPVLFCFVCYPLTATMLSGPALVSLETAAVLKKSGWWVVGPDPHGEVLLAEWIRAREWSKRLDPDVDDDPA